MSASLPRRAWLNARIVDPSQKLDVKGGLLIENGKVAALAAQ